MNTCSFIPEILVHGKLGTDNFVESIFDGLLDNCVSIAYMYMYIYIMLYIRKRRMMMTMEKYMIYRQKWQEVLLNPLLLLLHPLLLMFHLRSAWYMYSVCTGILCTWYSV